MINRIIIIGDTKRSPIFKNAIKKGSSLPSINLSEITVSELLNNMKNK